MKTILYVGIDPPKNSGRNRVVHCPLIETIARDPDAAEIKEAFQELPRYTHVIFTSKNTVRIFFSFLRHYSFNSEILKDKQMIAVGKMTAALIRQQGFQVAITAQEETSEGIVEELQQIFLEDAYIFWPHSSISRSVIADYFRKQGVKFQECLLYDTQFKRPEIMPDLSTIDEIVFTSPSTVDAYIHLFGSIPLEKKLTPIGPVTREKLKKKMNDEQTAH
jgi:uroporphyrinogen-III synthase